MQTTFTRSLAIPVLFGLATFAAHTASAFPSQVVSSDAATPTLQPNSRPPASQRNLAAAVASTPLESSLALWRQGDKKGAVDKFLQIDWAKTKPAFRPGSPLATREADLAKMPARELEALMVEVNTGLKDLKQLAAAVRDKGLASKDTDQARQWFAKLDLCGAALDQPEALVILKLTARAIRKMASTTPKPA